MTVPVCAMWLGHCGNPATRLVETYVPTGNTWTLLTFLICNQGRCGQAARWHLDAFGLRLFATRPLTAAELEAADEAVAA